MYLVWDDFSIEASCSSAFTSLFSILIASAAQAADAPKYESLRFPKVNMHAGPGMQYPVLWTYQRKGLPVVVTANYDVWKRVSDPDGTTGWVQETMLSDKRTVIAKDKQRTLRSDPKDAATAIALVDPGAIAKVQSCTNGWCAVKFDGYDGWMKEAELWGTLPGENFDATKK